MRGIVFSERLRSPFDEGIKNVTVHLLDALSQDQEVLALTSEGANDKDHGIRNFDANRLLLSRELCSAISSFRPDWLLYVPTACGTLFSFVRMRVLAARTSECRTAMLALQVRPHRRWERLPVARLAPDCTFAQSRRTERALQELGCQTALLPPAVDSERFRPATMEEKLALRSAYQIPAQAVVVTHVGHLKSERNMRRLVDLQREGFHVVVVGSTSTEHEDAVSEQLRAAGATVIDRYVPSIQDVYRFSDIYMFLVEEPTAAIDLPLSVLEAMACNLPTVSTPFGGLTDFFPTGSGLFYLDGRAELVDLARRAMQTECTTRMLVQSYTWQAAANAFRQHLFGTGAIK